MSENQNNEKDKFAEKPGEGKPWDVAIIGSGPAALTAAIYTTRGAASTLILGGESWGGQLMLTTTVDNYPGFPEGVQGPDLMKLMRKQAERFGAEFVQKNVDGVDFEKRPLEIAAGDKKYLAKTVVIATGADTKWLEVPGEEKLRGRGVSSCAPCDAPFYKGKEVVVVGGGDSAMEEAQVLTKYATSVTIVHRRDEFKASAAMQKKIFKLKDEGKVKILWDTEVAEMIGENKLEKVKLKTKQGSEQAKKVNDENFLKSYSGKKLEEKDGLIYWEIPMDGLFVAIGHIPATDVFAGKIETDKRGYIVVHHQTQTNIEDGVFVAGDVHDWHYRQAVTAAGFGCMAGMDALKYLDKDVPSW